MRPKAVGHIVHPKSGTQAVKVFNEKILHLLGIPKREEGEQVLLKNSSHLAYKIVGELGPMRNQWLQMRI